jgi:hypothetical protein
MIRKDIIEPFHVSSGNEFRLKDQDLGRNKQRNWRTLARKF